MSDGGGTSDSSGPPSLTSNLANTTMRHTETNHAYGSENSPTPTSPCVIVKRRPPGLYPGRYVFVFTSPINATALETRTVVRVVGTFT